MTTIVEHLGKGKDRLVEHPAVEVFDKRWKVQLSDSGVYGNATCGKVFGHSDLSMDTPAMGRREVSGW